MMRRVLSAAALSLAAAVAVSMPAANALASAATTGVQVVSDQTNLAGANGAGAASSALALDYVVLRDNFTTYATCESYRKNYVVDYPYHLSSYCTRTKQSNGRHWLYVAYDNCPDIAARKDA